MEFSQNSLLKGFRQQQKAHDRRLIESPPVSDQLIVWLEEAFPREPVKVNDELMAQKLTVRRGMDIIIDHLKVTNERQKRGIVEAYSSDNPCPT